MAENIDETLCFLVGPIGDPGKAERTHSDWLHDEIVQPVFKEHFNAMRVERADKITEPGMIDSQVITRLLEAKLVIADMSFLNPNAFYEIGIRHLKRLPIIHMFLAGSPIPFDVKPYRAIPFRLEHPQGLRDAREQLRDHISGALKEGYVVENPVTRARGYQQLDQHATDPQRVILDELRNVQARLSALESKERGTSLDVPHAAMVRALLNTDTGTRDYAGLFAANRSRIAELLSSPAPPTTIPGKTNDELLEELKKTLARIEMALQRQEPKDE